MLSATVMEQQNEITKLNLLDEDMHIDESNEGRYSQPIETLIQSYF